MYLHVNEAAEDTASKINIIMDKVATITAKLIAVKK